MDKIIKDLRILNAIGRRECLVFDRKFKYCTDDADSWTRCLSRFEYKGRHYKLKYFFRLFLSVLSRM